MSIQTQTDPKKQGVWWQIPAAMPQGLLTEMANTGGEFLVQSRPGAKAESEGQEDLTSLKLLHGGFASHIHTLYASAPPVHCVNVDIVS